MAEEPTSTTLGGAPAVWHVGAAVPVKVHRPAAYLLAWTAVRASPLPSGGRSGPGTAARLRQAVRHPATDRLFLLHAADASWTHAYKMGLLEWMGAT